MNQNLHVVITGASSGIGEATARELKISPNLMYSRVQNFLALDLIYPSSTQKRASKALQYYPQPPMFLWFCSSIRHSSKC